MVENNWQKTLKTMGKLAKKAQEETEKRVKQEQQEQQEIFSFSQEMQNVMPLKSSNRIPKSIDKTPIRVRKTETELDSSRFIFVGEDYLEDEPPRQYSSGGQGKNDIRKLLSAKLLIIATLDLHGYDIESAQTVLNEFIIYIQQRGVCGEIIHGSGLHARGFVSNLKRTVRKWLMAHPQVLAYTEPHENNDGSVLILLKRKNHQ